MSVHIPTADELYAVLVARVDAYQVAGWSARDGEEFYRALCEVGATAIAQVAERMRARLIGSASGPVRAQGQVGVAWSTGVAQDHGIRAGQVIAQTPWGVRYYLLEDLVATYSESPVAQFVDVEALWPGFDGNVNCGEFPSLIEWALPNTVDQAASIAWTDWTAAGGMAEFLDGVADGAITISGVTDITGGADAFLDLHAAGRGLPRVAGEADPSLQDRIRRLPDVVTPAAILRVANRVMAPYGVEVTLHEPWDYGFAFGRGAFGVHPPSRPWHFLLSVPSIPYAQPGFAFGQGAFGQHPFGTPDEARAGVYAGLQDNVDQIKAAGIWADVNEAA